MKSTTARGLIATSSRPDRLWLGRGCALRTFRRTLCPVQGHIGTPLSEPGGGRVLDRLRHSHDFSAGGARRVDPVQGGAPPVRLLLAFGAPQDPARGEFAGRGASAVDA